MEPAAFTCMPGSTQPAGTKIRIRIGGRTLTATAAQNATARDFLSLLPLSHLLEQAVGLFNQHSPRFVISLISDSEAEHA